ncbi:MAG: maltooligosyltrehalose trehalohydrolase [Frankiaceae bacterium]|nr:maltooligosyltrehalose trehalohydrolase [Frankiaceae bacterium]
MTEVWAPYASSVLLDANGTRTPMVRGDGGWWRSAEPLPPGTDYGFVLDGSDDVLPDPRSPRQPDGVHGRSRTVDHAAFAWTDAGWSRPPLAGAVVYELHVGTFTPEGTFDAAIAHLPHLANLGVTAVELLPVNAFPGTHGWGYDGVGLWAPHEPYGGPDGLKRLVDACHAAGLAVVLDVVYNHLGPSGNYLGRFGPYFTDRYRTPWGPAVNYDDEGSHEVREFVVGNARMWVRDYHVDGLRLDAVHAIFDQSATHVLEELTARVDAWVIAESDLNDPRVVTPRGPRNGLGCDAQWSDDFHHALHAALTGERDGYYADFGPLAHVAKALEGAYVYDGQHSAYRGRRHGRPVADLPATAFLGYLQDHDQVGNRALGERSSHLLSPGLLKVGAALVLTAPFVPMLFMGEEWGASTPWQYFTDHDDPGLADAVRKGRREEFRAFGWDPDDVPDPQDPATFARSRLRWDEVTEPAHADLLDWHRRLIALRRGVPALTDGCLAQATFDEAARTLVVERGDVVVLANLGGEPRTFDAAGEVLLASAAYDGGVLPGESVAILRR